VTSSLQLHPGKPEEKNQENCIDQAWWEARKADRAMARAEIDVLCFLLVQRGVEVNGPTEEYSVATRRNSESLGTTKGRIH